LGARLMDAGHVVRIAGSPNGSTLAQEYHLDYHPVGFNTNDLLLEEQCSWAIPGGFSDMNWPCTESGDCVVVSA